MADNKDQNQTRDETKNESAEEQAKEQEQQEAKTEMVTIILPVEFQTNGVKHGPGRVTVEANLADDLARRVDEYNRIEAFRVTPGDYQQKEAAGNFRAAGK